MAESHAHGHHTEPLTRGEWLGVVGLTSGLLGWLYLLSHREPATTLELECSRQCPADCTPLEPSGIL